MPDRRHLRRKLIEGEVTVEPGTLGFYARLHLRDLEVKNYSPATVRDRAKTLRYFLTWSNERAITKPEEVTVAVIERYQRFMYYSNGANGKRLSFTAQAARLMALRVFFRWLVRERVIEMSPAELVDLPRAEYRLPKSILTIEQVESIMNACNTATALGIRDRAIIELLFSSGLRRAEAAALKVWDVDTTERIAFVHGKGRKDRYVPIGERAALWIRKYIDEVRPQFASEPDSGYLFLTAWRQPLVDERISDIVRAAAKAAGFTKNISAHVFRHTMATMMLDGGADVRFVQAMLGHTDINTTVIYTRVAIKKLKAVHAIAHPAANLSRLKSSESISQEVDDLLHDES
jgi:integrase/recombinase XerD